MDAKKSVVVRSPPQVLVLHINRTAWHNGVQKIQTHVTCPMELSLAPFFFSLEGAPRYRLMSVITHHGHQMSGGHFTAYGRSVSSSSVWFHFNDAKVTLVSEEVVCAAQAYVLLYQQLRE